MDEAREFNLGTDERRLAIQYSRWLETQERLQGADTIIIGNAVEKYRELFNQLYDAANDFLVAHGYEPIGFIRGYAPHLQSQETQERFNSALSAWESTGRSGSSPPPLRGERKILSRICHGTAFSRTETARENFWIRTLRKIREVCGLHVGRALSHGRPLCGPGLLYGISEEPMPRRKSGTSWSRRTRCDTRRRTSRRPSCRDKGKLSYTSAPTYEDVHQAMEQYVEDQYQAIENLTLYGDLAVFLDDYANNLANKQLFEDRAMEKSFGRTSLNAISKAHRLLPGRRCPPTCPPP